MPAGNAAAVSDRSLTITRKFAASPERVFKAWTDPNEIARWLGPQTVKAEVTKMEPRTGGAYRINMHLASGEIMVVGGVYREVDAPRKLVFTWAWEKNAPAHTGGHDTQVTVLCRPVGKETEMTLLHENFDNEESRDSHNRGWNGSLDKLAEQLAGTSGRA